MDYDGAPHPDPTLPESLPRELLMAIVSPLDWRSRRWVRLVAKHWMAAVDALLFVSPLVAVENARGDHPHRRAWSPVPFIGPPSPEPDFVIRIDGDRFPIFRRMLNVVSRIGIPLEASVLASPGFKGLRAPTRPNSFRNVYMAWQMPCEVVTSRDSTGRSRPVNISKLDTYLSGGDGIDTSTDAVEALVLRCDSASDKGEPAAVLSVCMSYPGYDSHLAIACCPLDTHSHREPDLLAVAPHRATFRFPAAALSQIDTHGYGLAVVVGRDGGGSLRLSLFVFWSKDYRPLCVTFPVRGRAPDHERSPAPGNDVGLPIVASLVRGIPLSYLSFMGKSEATARVTVMWSDERDDIWSDDYPLLFDFLFEDPVAAGTAESEVEPLAATCLGDRDGAMVRYTVFCVMPSGKECYVGPFETLLNERRILP